MSNAEWHGLEAAELDARQHEVPERPNRAETQALDATKYAHVHYEGNYGLGCGGFQAYDDYDISKHEAHDRAWSLFGLCGHSITYYDADGNVVDSE